MGRCVTQLSSTDAWRVAALTMMNDGALSLALSGEQAALWLNAAANIGLAEAQLRFARMLLSGEGMAPDPARAFRLFSAAAAHGNADAENMVGRCHENGWGTARDFAQAAHWYRKAADKGFDWAQYNLGHLLLDGNGVARDPDEAFRLYKSAAEQGHARAMNLLARCHERGWGTAKDPVEARNWYRRSAEGGYFRGAYNYATILADEGCVTGARRWFAHALSTAPEPTRSVMVRALKKRPAGFQRSATFIRGFS